MNHSPARIQVLRANEHALWDAYVEAHPQATFFHKAGWQTVIEHVFGHSTYYLLAARGERVTGVLPLGRIRSILFGDSLISTPFCVQGGALADDLDTRRALEYEAEELARRLGTDYLELRSGQSGNGRLEKSLYVRFFREISADHDENMRAIPRKQRAMVRKGINAGLTAHVDSTVNRLFAAYSESVRNLGTPVFPKRYLETIKKVFDKDCEILTVTAPDGALVSSVMSFYFRDQVLPYYGGGTKSARVLKGNDFMYWELMRRAADRGVRLFDFGRSKNGTGSYSFKKNWGFDPVPMPYEYVLVNTRQLPDISPVNPKYQAFVRLWTRLPLPVSRMVGPLLAKNLG